MEEKQNSIQDWLVESQTQIQKEDVMRDEELWIEKDDNVPTIYPINRDQIQVTVNNTTLFALVEYIKRGDIELQPDFQRSYVWWDVKAEKLIDSVWNGLPIPQLFLLTLQDGKSIVLDGQQRLTSLVRFMLHEEDLKKVLPDTTFESFQAVNELQLKVSRSLFTRDKKDKDEKVIFTDLDRDTQRRFEGESLIIAQIKPTYSLFKGKEEELENLSKEIFYRLNTGWIKLTAQEIRHSLYHKEFMRELKKISFEKSWISLVPIGISKFKEDKSLLSEMLLRAFALLDTYGIQEDFDTIWKLYKSDGSKFEYTKPLNDFLDKYARMTDKFTPEQIQERLDLLRKLLGVLNSLFKEEMFKHQNVINPKTKSVRTNTFNMKYLDTLFVSLLDLFRYNPDIDPELLKEEIMNFKSNPDIIEEFVSSARWIEPIYVQWRVEWTMKIFKKLKHV